MHGVITAGVMGLKLLISKSLTVKIFADGGIKTKLSFLQSFPEALYMVDVYIKRA